jgi:hypothetical protein
MAFVIYLCSVGDNAVVDMEHWYKDTDRKS